DLDPGAGAAGLVPGGGTELGPGRHVGDRRAGVLVAGGQSRVDRTGPEDRLLPGRAGLLRGRLLGPVPPVVLGAAVVAPAAMGAVPGGRGGAGRRRDADGGRPGPRRRRLRAGHRTDGGLRQFTGTAGHRRWCAVPGLGRSARDPGIHALAVAAAGPDDHGHISGRSSLVGVRGRDPTTLSFDALGVPDWSLRGGRSAV